MIDKTKLPLLQETKDAIQSSREASFCLESILLKSQEPFHRYHHCIPYPIETHFKFAQFDYHTLIVL